MSELDAEGLAYRARALAQAHPLTRLAKQYLDQVVATEAGSQPLPEIGRWAGAALLTGYCVRRVEEEDLGVRPMDDEPPPLSLEQLEEAAAVVGGDLRASEDGSKQTERVIAALDLVVASEVSRRLDNWRDSVDEAAWVELEDYIAWWVVRGYATRVAEMARGAVRR